MKMNLEVRMKNPWFWVGIGSTVLIAMGISPEMLNSWGAVRDAVVAFVQNPYMIGCVALNVLSVFIDPTTHGVGDSAQAMTYVNPKRD